MTPPVLFVVSLAGSPRRGAMARRLAQWPGAWSFVDAVDGRALSPQELEVAYDEARAVRTCGRPLSLPEIGCALSHRRVYEIIAQRNLAAALVLEDDAEFGPELSEFPFWTLESGFDVISLYTFSGLIRNRPHARRGAFALHRGAGRVDNTVAYVISAAGAARLAAATYPIRSVADWPVAPEHLRFYVALPFPVRHPGADSLIAEERERLRRGARGEPRGRLARLLSRYIGNLTVPLFIRYLARRERYIDLRDYVRREIAFDLKRMLPMFYRYLGGS